jgi:hypothetical protein
MARRLAAGRQERVHDFGHHVVVAATIRRAPGGVLRLVACACAASACNHGQPSTRSDASSSAPTASQQTAGAGAGGTAGNPSNAGHGGVAARDAATADASTPPSSDAATTGKPDAGRAPLSDGGSSSAALCNMSTFVCDDFETPGKGGAPDAAKWRVITSYSGQPSTSNRVVIDDQHVAHGKQALHVHTETTDPVYIETLHLPVSSNAFFGRVLAYFDQDPGARTQGHWGAFVGLGKKAAAGQDIEVRIGGQFDILVVNYSPNDALQISSSRDGFYDDGMKLPIQTWTCFEFQFDGAGNQLHVFMDGAELERLHVTDWNQFGHGLTTDWSPTYDRLRIGYQAWNADTPLDVWYDAIALGPQRIGCDPL